MEGRVPYRRAWICRRRRCPKKRRDITAAAVVVALQRGSDTRLPRR
jgi:hypothetical protein